MKKIKNCLIAGLVIGACLTGASPLASAHSLWLNATEYSPKYKEGRGATSKVYMGWGHHLPVDDFIRPGAVDEYVVVGPDGKRETVKPQPYGFLETEVSFKRQGLYTVAVAKNPSHYTTYYDDKGKIQHVGAPKTGYSNIVKSLYAQQYTKTLIKVGNVADGTVAKPVGHNLEIVPLVNPYALNGGYGQVLPVKVLFNGKPAQSCRIFATYTGFSPKDDSAYSTTTDSEGIARIRLTHWGVWMLKANIKEEAPSDLSHLANEISYSATLTFEVQ